MPHRVTNPLDLAAQQLADTLYKREYPVESFLKFAFAIIDAAKPEQLLPVTITSVEHARNLIFELADDQLVYVAAALRDRFNDGPGTIRTPRYLAAATLAELLVPLGDPAAHRR